MNLKEKLIILSDSAKYDASCSSSGSKRNSGYGNTSYSGICHSFSSDGRCISLLKILLTNICDFSFPALRFGSSICPAWSGRTWHVKYTAKQNCSVWS